MLKNVHNLNAKLVKSNKRNCEKLDIRQKMTNKIRINLKQLSIYGINKITN